MDRRGWRARLVAFCSILSLALFTTALTGSVSHVSLVQHEICAAHGALVEHYGQDAADAAERSADSESHESHESHEPQKHCSLLCIALAASSPPTDLLGPVTFVVADASAPFSRLPVEHDPHEPLRLAPKTSPPSV